MLSLKVDAQNVLYLSSVIFLVLNRTLIVANKSLLLQRLFPVLWVIHTSGCTSYQIPSSQSSIHGRQVTDRQQRKILTMLGEGQMSIRVH